MKISIVFSDGIRIASSNTIESLLEEDFKLIINDNEYIVSPPLQERCTIVSYHIETSFPSALHFYITIVLKIDMYAMTIE